MTSTLLLPSCLSQSTLGDVLGGLHRQGLSGVLQVLVSTKTHEIELQQGCIVRVTLADETQRLGEALTYRASNARHFERVLRLALARASDRRPLGERLVACGAADAEAVRDVLQELHQTRLNVLFAIRSARLRFRLVYRPTRSALVLGPALFLHRRKRLRDCSRSSTQLPNAEVQRAYQLLGLEPGASAACVKAAFRSKAVAGHPDKFVARGPAAVERATRGFRECAHSYRVIMDSLRRG